MTPIKEAQRSYDAMEPPDYFGCEENGHMRPLLSLGHTDDGALILKCKKCGEEFEQ